MRLFATPSTHIAASPHQDPLSRKAESPHCDSLSRKAEGPRNDPSSHSAESLCCDSSSRMAAMPHCDPSSRMVVRFRCRSDPLSRKAAILCCDSPSRTAESPCCALLHRLAPGYGKAYVDAEILVVPCCAASHPRITHFLDIEVIFYVSWGVRSTSVQFSISDTFLTCGNASASKLGEPLRSQLPKKSPLRRGFRPNYRHFWLRYPKNALFGVLRKPLPPLCRCRPCVVSGFAKI